MKAIRTQLESEKSKLMAHIFAQTQKDFIQDHEIGDEIDGSVQVQAQELSILMRGREQQRLSLIIDALKRMDAGEYGYCESCGENIPVKRLKILRFVRLCVECQQVEERQKMGDIYANSATAQLFDED